MPAGDVAAALAVAALAYVSATVLVYGAAALGRGACRAPRRAGCVLDAVVPVYAEPIEEVVRTVRSAAALASRVIVVWDGAMPPGARERLEEAAGGRLVLIHRGGRGGKASALNEALSASSADHLLLLDAGDTVEGDAAQLCGCCSVVTAWRPAAPAPGLREAVAAATAFLAALLYRGRCLLGLPVVFLGTGSSVSRAAASAAGGWREDAILEDVEFGFRLVEAGCRPCYTEDVVTRVHVPPSYRALKLQQARWMRGVGQALASRWWRSLDQLAYLLYYPAAAAWHPLLLAAAVLGASQAAALAALAALAFTAAAVGAVYTRFLVGLGYGPARAVRLAGASSALGLVMAPSLLAALAAGLAGSSEWGPPTPRRRGGGRPLDVEPLYALACAVAAALAPWQLSLALLAYPAALLYVVVRFGGELA